MSIRRYVVPFLARYGLVVVAAALIAYILLGGRLPWSTASATAAAPDASTWVTCTPQNVTVYNGRIHVKCTASFSGIQYFAVSTANAASASRFLSILATAEAAGKNLSILYDPADTSGSAFGCGSSDCRIILGASMLQ